MGHVATIDGTLSHMYTLLNIPVPVSQKLKSPIRGAVGWGMWVVVGVWVKCTSFTSIAAPFEFNARLCF